MFIDNSEMFWSENDNYKSVNSRTYASEIFDLEVVDINSNFKIPNKIDLFLAFFFIASIILLTQKKY